MKKRTKIILIVLLIILVIIGVIVSLIFIKSKESIETKRLKNVEGQYSNVLITDIESAKESIKSIQNELKINSIETELKELKSDTYSDVINTYKFQQIYDEIEVYQKGLTVYTDKYGKALGVINNFTPIQNFDTKPKHTDEELKDVAINSLDEYQTKEIQNSDLIIYTLEDESNILAYKYDIDIGNTVATIIVNDNTQEILEKIIPEYESISSDLSKFKTDENIKSIAKEVGYTVDSEYALVDKERNIVMAKIDNNEGEIYSWNTKEEEQLEDNQLGIKTMSTIQQVYDYYIKKFNYVSINGENITLDVMTGIKNNDKNEDVRDNAFFISPNIILLGDYNYYNESIEVLGHEYTHGVFNYIVGYSNSIQGKAINEAYADIMGMCIESYYENTDRIDGYINENNEGVKRDIANSKNKYKANSKSNGLTEEEHTDSTIISRAAYKMSEYMTVEELESLWFNSMKLLPTNYDFYDCEYAVLRTAKYMNFTDEQQRQIEKAFIEVGLADSDSIRQNIYEILDNNSFNTEENTKRLKDDVIGNWKIITTNSFDYSAEDLYKELSNINQLTINEDDTYVLKIGTTYNQKGDYQISGNEINLINTEDKGDNKKIVEKLIVKVNNSDLQIILEETLENNSVINVVFERAKDMENTENEVIQAGSYNLHYGTYKGTDYEATALKNTEVEITITLNKGNTYTISKYYTYTKKTETSTGEYEIIDGSLMGEYYEKYKLLKLSEGSMYMISDNDTLEVMAGTGARFTYQGN